MNRYKWQKTGEVALDRETNTSFRVDAPNDVSAAFVRYVTTGGIVEDVDPDPIASHFVSKLTIRRRLRAAGLEDMADAVLASNPQAQKDWNDAQDIDATDAQVREMLTAIGANLDEILA